MEKTQALTRREFGLALAVALQPLGNGSDFVTAFSPHPASVPARPKTILIGDSLAYMMRPHLEPHGITVRGKGGSNLGEWLKKGWLRDALRQLEPELVLVSLGANDYPVRVNRQAFQKRAERLVELCTIQGIDVLWLAPPSARVFIAAAARRAGADVLEPPAGIEMAGDHVHPTRRGFVLWTDAILRHI